MYLLAAITLNEPKRQQTVSNCLYIHKHNLPPNYVAPSDYIYYITRYN